MIRFAITALGNTLRKARELLRDAGGSAVLEFSISLPLLVVFVVGIYDFSGAFNQRQKIEQAAQEGAIIAGAQPTNDIVVSNPSPDSVQPVVYAVFNSLAASGVLPLANQGTCSLNPFPTPTHSSTSPNLTWVYTISLCSGTFPNDNLIISVNRGWVSSTGSASTATAVGTIVTVTFPYHFLFNRVIQLLIPGATYADHTDVAESATVHNQT